VLTSKVNGNKLTLPEVGYLDESAQLVYNNGGLGFISNDESDSSKTLYLLTFSGVGGISFQTRFESQVTSMPLLAVREAPKAIDLGLPSGTLWADRNVGAFSPTDYGDYFSWGNTEGHEEGSGYDFSKATYNNTPGASIKNNLTAANDAATVNMGGNWRMPTTSETDELAIHTDHETATINGISGMKFMKKTDHSVYVFFPYSGYYDGSTHNSEGSFSCLWTTICSGSTSAYGLNLNQNGTVTSQYNVGRSYGFNVRAVQ
jgi:hypothetical protein